MIPGNPDGDALRERVRDTQTCISPTIRLDFVLYLFSLSSQLGPNTLGDRKEKDGGARQTVNGDKSWGVETTHTSDYTTVTHDPRVQRQTQPPFLLPPVSVLAE